MDKFRTLSFFIIFNMLISQIRICRTQSFSKFTVNEETLPGYVLGNIDHYVTTHFYETSSYEASLINNYFSILSNKDLVVKKKIDLETFCNEANQCCDSNQCVVNFTVFVKTKNSINHRFTVEIEVIDINDNKPTFLNPSQTVTILENSKIGTSIILEGGFDKDVSSINKIKKYILEEETKTFELDNNDMTSLSLVLLKHIDYERQNVYHARLSACDNDSSCAHQRLIINVQDDNDNYPRFKDQRYEVRILENFEVGTVVVAARAIDLDGPQYNKTKYSFYNNQDLNLANKFAINVTNGDIILKSKLSAVQKSLYTFKIYAVDSFMSGKKEIADVVIHVIDINDNKPIIEIYNAEKILDSGDSFEMKIAENVQGQKLMSMKVSDNDLGNNAKVVCDLKDTSQTLELKFLDISVYEVHNVRSYDYEQETQIKAMFECRDGGSPPLTSYKSLKINIEDVNEYAPEFELPKFQGSLKENTGPEEQLLTVRATDKDGSAFLQYSIEDSAQQYFSINPDTGLIKTASTAFDREQIGMKVFRVTVTDALLIPQTAETSVQVTILDENDNDPIFTPSSLQFSILENQPQKSKLFGQLAARDIDKDPSNSYIVFSLLDTYDSELKKCDRPYFRIKINGDVETLLQLDREVNANFTLTIEAKDRGNPPRFTRANATVIVHDVNDNAPEWIYPRQMEQRRHSMSSLPMLNLTEITEQFFLIMKLKAHDPDQNEAGRVRYLLINHHEALFSLNETNGELRTEKSPLPYGQYQLQIRATDHGYPARNSDSWLLINVLDSGKSANINLTIIIGMVAITALISIFLIVAIICVRRRPHFHQPSPKESSNHFIQSHNQWMLHGTDENLMQPLSDNDGCVYLPTNYYEPQEQIMMQTLTGSRPPSRQDYSIVLPSSNQYNNVDQKFVSQSSLNVDRTIGTLRANNGQYCSMNAPNSGIIINGQELDGDSADSGKGASEVDLRLQHQLNNASRNYTTMPFPVQSTAITTFGFQPHVPSNQYYTVTTNPRSVDSRFLTIHPSVFANNNRRVTSPTFNSSSQCQCFILPEDDTIHIEDGTNLFPSTTLSTPANHDQNCFYRDTMAPSTGPGYISNCLYFQGSQNELSRSPIPFHSKSEMTNDLDVRDNNRENSNYVYG